MLIKELKIKHPAKTYKDRPLYGVNFNMEFPKEVDKVEHVCGCTTTEINGKSVDFKINVETVERKYSSRIRYIEDGGKKVLSNAYAIKRKTDWKELSADQRPSWVKNIVIPIKFKDGTDEQLKVKITVYEQEGYIAAIDDPNKKIKDRNAVKSYE